jgi:hypothetical protein
MDLNNAFLNEPIREEIYVEQPLISRMTGTPIMCINALEIYLFLMLSRSRKLILLFLQRLVTGKMFARNTATNLL